MSDDMIERVARAICGNAAQGFCADVGGDLGCKRGRGESYNGTNCVATTMQLALTPHWDQARAAIAAMREPTEEMVLEGYGGDYRTGDDVHFREAWIGMVDKALGK